MTYFFLTLCLIFSIQMAYSKDTFECKAGGKVAQGRISAKHSEQEENSIGLNLVQNEGTCYACVALYELRQHYIKSEKRKPPEVATPLRNFSNLHTVLSTLGGVATNGGGLSYQVLHGIKQRGYEVFVDQGYLFNELYQLSQDLKKSPPQMPDAIQACTKRFRDLLPTTTKDKLLVDFIETIFKQELKKNPEKAVYNTSLTLTQHEKVKLQPYNIYKDVISIPTLIERGFVSSEAEWKNKPQSQRRTIEQAYFRKAILEALETPPHYAVSLVTEEHEVIVDDVKESCCTYPPTHHEKKDCELEFKIVDTAAANLNGWRLAKKYLENTQEIGFIRPCVESTEGHPTHQFFEKCSPDILGSFPLHSLAGANDVAGIRRKLAENPALIHEKDYVEEDTPLHFAAALGSFEAVQALLEAGAHINTLNDSRRTPAALAVDHNEIKVYHELRRRGGDLGPKEFFSSVNPEGVTLLHKATQNQLYETIKELIEGGADVNSLGKVGSTALHMAVKQNDFKAVDLLLNGNANINLKDIHGHSPLYVALVKSSTPMVNHLLTRGARVEKSISNHPSSLHLAAAYGDKNMVQLILRAEPTLITDHEVEKGTTPLILAVEKNNTSAMEALLAYQAPSHINLKSLSGKTALMTSVEENNKDAIRLLIKNQARTDIKDLNGLTAVDYANLQNRLDLLMELRKN